MINTKKYKKIVACPKCKGVGLLKVEYYKSDREPDTTVCTVCKGSGRMLRIVTVETVTVNVNQINLETITV